MKLCLRIFEILFIYLIMKDGLVGEEKIIWPASSLDLKSLLDF